MEGIVPTFGKSGIRAPYRAVQLTWSRLSFYHPEYADFPYPEYPFLNSDGQHDIRYLTRFLQSWLFFGLLSTFLDISIDHNAFILDGYIEVNALSVQDDFRKWKNRSSRSWKKERTKALKDINELLEYATRKCDEFEDAADIISSRDVDFDKVALSIKLLINLLHLVAADVFSDVNSGEAKPRYVSVALESLTKQDAKRYLTGQTARLAPLPPGADVGGRATRLLLEIFQNNGWCPLRARDICRSHDYVTANKLAGIAPNRFLRRSHVGPMEEIHVKCFEADKCVAHNIIVDSERPYPHRHAAGHQDCNFDKINIEEIRKIVVSGGIPLLSIRAKGAELDLKVERYTTSIAYTAVSHVWSDGLGNPSGNSIPHCQLLRLRDMIYETYNLEKSSPVLKGKNWRLRIGRWNYWNSWRRSRAGRPSATLNRQRIFFWLDTLCIPVSRKVQDGSRENTRELLEPESSSIQARLEKQAKVEKLFKLKCLNLITPIFAGAYTVLILDQTLEDTRPGTGNMFRGDYFAAIVLSSTWMQRGWTLQEGITAQTCIFRVDHKPYDMSTALEYGMDSPKWQDSPLSRAYMLARDHLSLLVGQALFDEKRRLTADTKASRFQFLSTFLNVPTFVRTWNALLERSTTKPEDGVIILANLLDFNVHSFSRRNLNSSAERLVALVQSCRELPLSILYNTGPRLNDPNHPEGGWIPTEIAGSRLVGGGIIRKMKPDPLTSNILFKIDQALSPRGPLMILRTSSNYRIPFHDSTFAVEDFSTRDRYFVEIQRNHQQPSEFSESQQRSYDQAIGTCLILDFSCGAVSLRGFRGRGVRLGIHLTTSRTLRLRYSEPLVFWTADQWKHRQRDVETPIPIHILECVNPKSELVLENDWRIWSKPLPRRPAFSQHPASIQLLAFVTWLCIWLGTSFGVFMLVAGTPVEPKGAMLKVMLMSFLLLSYYLTYHQIRKFFAMFMYKAWLKTFDENWEDRMNRAQWIWRFLRVFGRSRAQYPGITQTTVALPLRNRRVAQSEVDNIVP